MLHIAGARGKFEVAPDRFTGQSHAEEWKPEYQGK